MLLLNTLIAVGKVIFQTLSSKALGMAADVAENLLGKAQVTVGEMLAIGFAFLEGKLNPQPGVTLNQDESLQLTLSAWNNMKAELYGAEGAIADAVKALLDNLLALLLPALGQVFSGVNLVGLFTAAL